MLRMGTFCSGIGAPEVAARGMFEPLWFSEIEPFPSAVLAHHWPHVPNLGDMTAPDIVQRIADIGLPDLVVAGLPCQPFSVAGLRKGEADPRNLTSRFVEIADAIDDLRRDAGKPPVWWLVENVPGLLNDRGNAFGALLGSMVGSESAIVPGRRWECAGVATGPRRSAAWRVLDAQFFGVAQRRRRVFAIFVADRGSLQCADALLPIIDSMSWDSPPRRETRKDVAPTISARTKGGGGLGTDFDCDGGLIASTGNVAHCLNAGGMGRQDYETETMIAHTLKGEGFDASEDGTGRGTPIVPVDVVGTMKACRDSGGWSNSADHAAAGYMIPVAFDCKGTEVQYSTDGSHPTLRSMGHSNSHQNAGGHAAVAIQERAVSENPNAGPQGKGWQEGVGYTLEARHHVQAVAFDMRGRDGGAMPEGPHDTANIRAASGGSSRSYVAQSWAVRRLMPVECARLQGFPDDHAAITYRRKPAADGNQYKAFGNSMAVPCVAWILSRMKISMEASE